ncbi:Lon family ATP-dependent protease [Dehalobacter sp. DCM]|uniref:Lon family ATP-dependent protease n=1 Tax=Dehalobacter sp. DCM TaxID=2907827 RepID=UPI00308134F3|nr:Lon family ATP-dependent protease [Dehalobacter sp. DCM]
MKSLLKKFIRQDSPDNPQESADSVESMSEFLTLEVDALYVVLSNLYGTDKLILKASKLEALPLMRSERLEDRIVGLQKLVNDDPTDKPLPDLADIPNILQEIEAQIAEVVAKRSVEDRLNQAVQEKMQERHEEYIKEIKTQVLKETSGPENAQTLRKLAQLEKMNATRPVSSAIEVLRPRTPEEIIGQEKALQALLAKLATPFPQHILIYGPPGVGKTSAARVALETVKEFPDSPFGKDAPFIEVDGTTLRWDPRDVTNPLLGSVHDPIYQGAKRDLADTGIPEPKLGLVNDAHTGVLFIDEIGEMDPTLLNKLLKVLEDKRVNFESSYYDPLDPQIPLYIKKVFEEGVPADFVLIGATTREPQDLNPALRSRCAEVYFEPLEPEHIKHIVRQAAEKLGVCLDENVPEIISEYMIEGRKSNSILLDAYGLARFRNPGQKQIIINEEDVREVLRSARLTPFVQKRVSEASDIGRILGLGVAGFLGSVLEIEVKVFNAETGKGSIRFNETAGSMARDAVFNAAAVIRSLTGEDVKNYDLHVNVVGGGRIDGPSAGLATTMAIYSALKKQPLKGNVAVTGEISIQGRVRPVGGIYEKIFGAKQAGVHTVIIPKENLEEVPSGLRGIEVIAVENIEEAIKIAAAE